MLTLAVDAPPKLESAQARFALATGLIYQGGGIITVPKAARIAGMEERAFVEAASALGKEMEEMIPQAYDAPRIAKSLARMEREGTKSFEEVSQKLGF